MRINGHAIGARATVSTRMSVILRPEGLELVFVFCGSASSSSSAQKALPINAALLINERRPLFVINAGRQLHCQTENLSKMPQKHEARPTRGKSTGRNRVFSRNPAARFGETRAPKCQENAALQKNNVGSHPTESALEMRGYEPEGG